GRDHPPARRPSAGALSGITDARCSGPVRYSAWLILLRRAAQARGRTVAGPAFRAGLANLLLLPAPLGIVDTEDGWDERAARSREPVDVPVPVDAGGALVAVSVRGHAGAEEPLDPAAGGTGGTCVHGDVGKHQVEAVATGHGIAVLRVVAEEDQVGVG